MLILGTTIGVINGSAKALIREDVKPLLFFFLLPFFYFSITDVGTIGRLSAIFRYAGVGMAIAFILILLLIHTGVIPFLGFFNLVEPTVEFYFRGEITFFYKGFLYMCVGLIFLIEGRAKKWQIILVLIAIIFTVTRGFWMSLLLSYGLYYLIFQTKNVRLALRGAGLVILGVLVLLYSKDLIAGVSRTVDRQIGVTTRPGEEPKPHLLGDRTHSDNERIREIRAVAERVTPVSAVIGHGFGQGTPTRPIHMEISYLEIFHKQGVAGLLCWLLIFLTGFRKFLNAREHPFSVPFFLSFVLAFIQSFANQFINNPIGLFLIMTAIISLDRMKSPSLKNAHFEKKRP